MLLLLIKSVFSLEAYYRLMHRCFNTLYGEQQMLHYPLYKEGDQNLLQSQMNLTAYCLEHLPALQGKRVLDIGCGNGVQSIYISQNYHPQHLRGIDINALNIASAENEKQKKQLTNVDFNIDNSQLLVTVADNSLDVIICVESAFHYPDKAAFLNQVKRVLVSGGYFLIADLLLKKNREPNRWERRVSFNNWPYRRYCEKFEALDMELITDKNFTDLVIKGFNQSKNWFGNSNVKKDSSYYLGKFYAKCIIRLYKYQLRYHHQYQLFVGRIRTQQVESNIIKEKQNADGL